MSESRSLGVIASILAGLRFPADRWQVLAHVDHYGADPGTRHLFWSLPERNYPTAGSVLAALGMEPPGRPGEPTVNGSARPKPGADPSRAAEGSRGR